MVVNDNTSHIYSPSVFLVDGEHSKHGSVKNKSAPLEGSQCPQPCPLQPLSVPAAGNLLGGGGRASPVPGCSPPRAGRGDGWWNPRAQSRARALCQRGAVRPAPEGNAQSLLIWSQKDLHGVPALPLTLYETSVRASSLTSEGRFAHFQNGNDSTYHSLCWGED